MNELIMLEINGKLVPKRPDDPTPQVFIVTGDANGSLPLKPFNGKTGNRVVQTYVVGFRA
jgi:hypothetical protein